MLICFTTSTAAMWDKRSSCRHIWRLTGGQAHIHVQHAHTQTHTQKMLPSHYITLICQRAPSALRWGFLLSAPLSLSTAASPPPLLIKMLISLFSSNLCRHRWNHFQTEQWDFKPVKCTGMMNSLTSVLGHWSTDYIQHVIVLIHLSSRQSRNKKTGLLP